MAFTKSVSGVLVMLLLTEVSYGAAVQSSSGRPVGIVGHDIDGVLYDFSFQGKHYVSIWGYGPETFGATCDEPAGHSWFSCEQGPRSAMPAIAAGNKAFNVAGVRAVQFHDRFVGRSTVVPWRIFSGDSKVGVPRKRPFAEFSRPIPIPAAVWLFVSALIGLGWFRRRQTA